MYFNLLVVFFVTGFWHGAEWTFIVWGMWHGLFIVIEKITGWHKSSGRLLSRTFRHTVTLFIVLVGWVFFRANDLSHATAYLKNMFGLVEHTYLPFGPAYFYDNIQIIAFVAGILFLFLPRKSSQNALRIGFGSVHSIMQGCLPCSR